MPYTPSLSSSAWWHVPRYSAHLRASVVVSVRISTHQTRLEDGKTKELTPDLVEGTRASRIQMTKRDPFGQGTRRHMQRDAQAQNPRVEGDELLVAVGGL